MHKKWMDLMEEWVKKHLEKCSDTYHRGEKFDRVLIPGYKISQLQPLNVLINKPFTGSLRKEYKAWFLSENLPPTPSGKFKRASASKRQNISQMLGRLQEKQ
jgi:hypothetical protein